jgi:uncharacterized protein (TIGR02996 family)
MSPNLPVDCNNGADLRALLADAVAHPEDEAAHLVLADWLEENGQDDRALLIRLSWELAHLQADDSRRVPLEQRQEVVLEAVRSRWLEPLGGPGSEWRLERGLPIGARVSIQTFLVRGEELIEQTGVCHLSLFSGWLEEGERLDLSALANCPTLARVRALELRRQFLGAQELAVLLRSPFLGPLHSLDLGENGLGDEGAALLAVASRLQGLVILDLEANQLGDEGVRALLHGPLLAGVREVDLSYNSITDTGVRFLARSAQVNGLVVLDLKHNAISDTGVEMLLRSPHLHGLRGLDLSNNFLGDPGVTALLEAALQRDMLALDVHDNPVGDTALAAWRRSRFNGAF